MQITSQFDLDILLNEKLSHHLVQISVNSPHLLTTMASFSTNERGLAFVNTLHWLHESVYPLRNNSEKRIILKLIGPFNVKSVRPITNTM